MNKILMTLTASALLSLPSQSAPSVSRPAQPNIILIMTDDQGYGDMGWTGHPRIRTPELDRLRTGALAFSEFQTSPTCAPTRCALLSGRHEFYAGVTHTIYERERMSLRVVTLPQTLKRAGYTTGIFGKWHLGDEAAYRPDQRGFDEVFIHGGGGIGQTYPGSCGDAPNNRYFDPYVLHNNQFEKTAGFCTDVFFRQALTWIDQAHTRGKPFFCYLTPNAPHSPYQAPDTWVAPYRNKGLSEDQAAFCGMVANIDWNVGRLLKQLEAWKLSENTLILFLGDNGTCQPKLYQANMKGSKGTPFEGGTRVGLLARWKGVIPENTTCSALTAHIDLYPTLCALAGAALPREQQMDGRSLVPLLTQPQAPWEDRMLFTHVGRWAPGGAVQLDPHVKGMPNITTWQPTPQQSPLKYKNAAVRTARYRFYPETKTLYDIQKDRDETTDLAAQHPDVVENLQAAYDRWWLDVLPGIMQNENLKDVVSENPFKQLYRLQKF